MSQLKRSKHLKIPLKDIKRATQNFQECIGHGGYGMVYKGELVISGKPTTAAIKRLNERSGQGLKEFLTEIQLLCGQKHPNLIHLLGYCDEKKEKIIVYEYPERGSLDRYLRGDNTLTWLQRLKICVDAARGLEYLHYRVGDHQTIIHRDIKSANILLDDNWVAKLSDLGLAKLSLAGVNRSEVVSHPCGTFGYCDPQYRESSIVTKESDIYSFGIVLFEVVSGRLCTNIKGNDGFFLSPDSAKDYYSSKSLDEIVDPSLEVEMNLDSMNRFVAIAKECLHDDRAERPPMHLVVKELEGLLELEQSPQLEQSLELEESSEISQGPDSESNPEFQSVTSTFYNYRMPPQNIAHDICNRNEAAIVFNNFDLDKDGVLNTRELEAFICHRRHQNSYAGEHAFSYNIDDEKGLTFNGFLLSLGLQGISPLESFMENCKAALGYQLLALLFYLMITKVGPGEVKAFWVRLRQRDTPFCYILSFTCFCCFCCCYYFAQRGGPTRRLRNLEIEAKEEYRRTMERNVGMVGSSAFGSTGWM